MHEMSLFPPKFYGPLTIWSWLRISRQSSLNVIYYLIISAWQWLMSFTYMPCIPMQIKPNKSPLRNRFLVLLFWEIGHLSSPSRSCLGRLILICSRWGALRAKLPHSEGSLPDYILTWPSMTHAKKNERRQMESRGREGKGEGGRPLWYLFL